MLNYFNYFTEIEQYFQSKREAFTLLSSVDWVLMESWKESGIPLELVFKGIDRAFDRPNAKRKIGSLAYCTKAIADVCEEHKNMLVDRPVLPDIANDEVSAYLEKLAGAVEKLRFTFADFGSRLEAIAASIRQLDVSSLRDAEQSLNAMEEKVISLIKLAAEEQVLLAVKQSVDADLNAFRSTMTAEQLAMLEQQLWRRKLMERFDVPRLSLFYLI